MEARAAKCAFTLHSPALQNPQTGWITLTRTNFGSLCLCQHGPPATSRCCSQSCVKWKNPVSSRAMGSLSLLRRIDSLLYVIYFMMHKIRFIWPGRLKMPKPAEKLLVCCCTGWPSCHKTSVWMKKTSDHNFEVLSSVWNFWILFIWQCFCSFNTSRHARM